MLESKIVEINGIFLGAAVALDGHAGWKFVAADARAGDADGAISDSYDRAQTLARRAFWSYTPATNS